MVMPEPMVRVPESPLLLAVLISLFAVAAQDDRARAAQGLGADEVELAAVGRAAGVAQVDGAVERQATGDGDLGAVGGQVESAVERDARERAAGVVRTDQRGTVGQGDRAAVDRCRRSRK